MEAYLGITWHQRNIHCMKLIVNPNEVDILELNSHIDDEFLCSELLAMTQGEYPEVVSEWPY